MSSQAAPRYVWDERLKRYRDSRTGRMVRRTAVRDELDRGLDSMEREVRQLTQALRDGTVSLADWQHQMAGYIRAGHAAAGALAMGGWDKMGPREWATVNANVTNQLRYLARFASQMAMGTTPMDGRVVVRAGLYVVSARVAYEAWARQTAIDAGYMVERNLLHARDSCAGCRAATALGWVAIGSLPPIGTRECRARCRCTIEYLMEPPDTRVTPRLA